MSPEEIENLVKDLPSSAIISAAIECGNLKKRNNHRGIRAIIPSWLADILARRGTVECAEAAT